VWSFGGREPNLGPFNRDAPCAIVSVDGGRHWRVVQDFSFGALGSSVSRVRFADKEGLLYYSTGLNDYNIYRFTGDYHFQIRGAAPQRIPAKWARRR
jgi:hypothetical protein